MSKRHNCTGDVVGAGRLVYSKGGSLVQLQRFTGGGGGPEVVAKRGRIVEHSAKSRLRLKYMLARLDRSRLAGALFVTLTYPGHCPCADDHKTYKRHLHRFGVGMGRLFPGVSWVWKLEFQRRGAPHYHLLMFGIDPGRLVEVRARASAIWYRVVGSGDDRHLRAGTQVDVCRGASGAMTYLCKYLSKSDQSRPGNFTGRYWGVWRRSLLPWAEVVLLEVEHQEAVRIARVQRTLIRKRVEESRWRSAMRRLGDRFASRQEWEHAWSQARMTGRAVVFGSNYVAWCTAEGVRSPLKTGNGGALCSDGEPGPLWEAFRPPARYRVRNNGTLNLVCDAESFMGAVERGRRAGVWARGACPF